VTSSAGTVPSRTSSRASTRTHPTAHRRIQESLDREGPHSTVQHLRHHPELFGPLRGSQLAAVKTATRRAALAAAHRAAHQLPDIEGLRARIVDLDDQVKATAPLLAVARDQAGSAAQARRHLPTPLSLQLDIARVAKVLGPQVVQAMSAASAYWAVRVLRNAARTYRDLLLERGQGRDDDGLSR
jgi:hypothetical protein